MDDVAIVKELTEHDNKLRQHDIEIRDIKKRQENIDDMVKAVTTLNIKLDHTTEKVNATDKKVDEIGDKIEEINAKSGKRWDSVVEKVIFAIVGAVVGFLLKQVGVF